MIYRYNWLISAWFAAHLHTSYANQLGGDVQYISILFDCFCLVDNSSTLLPRSIINALITRTPAVSFE